MTPVIFKILSKSVLSKKVPFMDIRPLRTEDDYEAALKEIENLWGAPYGSPEGDRLEVLVTLVEAYEEKHYPIEPPDPIEAILHQMESQGLNRRDLEPLLGSRGRVSEILNRKRPLSIEMIRNLHAGLGIAADVLVQPYELRRA
jgi:HTH-type transcriptional regulator/antitoxin HigA